MRESIQLDQIRCERCVNRLAQAIAPLKGVIDARIEMGTSSLIIEYDDDQRSQVDDAITAASFRIVERHELAAVEG